MYNGLQTGPSESGPHTPYPSVIVVSCLAGGKDPHIQNERNAGTSPAKGLITITLAVLSAIKHERVCF